MPFIYAPGCRSCNDNGAFITVDRSTQDAWLTKHVVPDWVDPDRRTRLLTGHCLDCHLGDPVG